MVRNFFIAAILAVVVLQTAIAAPQPVRLTAKDGVAIAGRFYPAVKPRAIILLFHQAGSSKDEYATIAPKLVADGFDALAIDQRSGGNLFGPNETAGKIAGRAGYARAQRDLEAAVAWAQHRREPIILWGSSYSAALVFRVAALHPARLEAVLAFSPGEYLDHPPSVAASAASVDVPVFVTSASNEEEIAAARSILANVRSGVKSQFVPEIGVHGSSTLIVSRNPGGAQTNWAAVRAFLAKVAP